MEDFGDFPGWPGLRLRASAGVWVHSLVGELRSHGLHDTAGCGGEENKTKDFV